VVVTDRAVSTVVDATLAMVLIGGAVIALSVVPAAPTADVGTDAADGAADLLGGTTATVNYSLSPGARHADPSLVAFPEDARSGRGFGRIAHGTVASLVVAATVGDAGLDGEAFSRATDGLAERVGTLAVTTLERPGVEVQVRAVWRPFPESDLRGSVLGGPTPPPDADVHAATVTVASGFDFPPERALAAADRGFGAVADAFANATVEGLFPPERAGLALRGDYPLSALVAYRYRHAAEQVGAVVAPPVAEGNATLANDRLAAALSERFERTLRSAYPTPRAAAAAGTVGRVTIAVRTWSR
jgi:hypothetical protein